MIEPPPVPADRASDKETSRLEAFSDGVLAVIITITAFGLRAPAGGSFGALGHRLPALLIYVLSFVFIPKTSLHRYLTAKPAAHDR